MNIYKKLFYYFKLFINKIWYIFVVKIILFYKSFNSFYLLFPPIFFKIIYKIFLILIIVYKAFFFLKVLL
ncbi:hypothetical protein H8356DRAFT_1615968 [Neocallimastix lanati (nom. inval.)]|nr:hypothetical protein H8356DRAFT_1615968 [Neocallimastix sp. JGI-2020a]